MRPKMRVMEGRQLVITPMVVRLVRDPFDRDGWLFELKGRGSHADNADYDRT